MNMPSAADRRIPSASSLIIRQLVGKALRLIGILVAIYWAGSHYYNWALAPWYYTSGEPASTHPVLEWYLPVLLIALGSILVWRSRKQLHYWHRYVESGVITDKDIVRYNERYVFYVVYVEGKTRAGNTHTYGHRMSHGRYEQMEIKDSFPSSE